MAFAIEHKTQVPYVIGTNQNGELGLSKEDEGDVPGVIDRDSRKTFTVQEALKDKPVDLVAIGKSGFVLAIGKIVDSDEEPA